jgi:hypothetical protein
MTKTTIHIQGSDITILKVKNETYVSLTEMIKSFGDDTMIYSWMRNRNTVEFLGIWEELNNPELFIQAGFDKFRMEAGLNNFNLTPKKWVDATGAIGIMSKAGRYGGGTFAHRDIAFEFGSWLSPSFKLYMIKEFQRLKEIENATLSLEWNLSRMLSKINFKIHTDAIKENLIPQRIAKGLEGYIYASEADVLNMALFGISARQWREQNATKEGNIRDSASVEQLVVLSNLESINAVFIAQGLEQEQRIAQLNDIAITQMRSLLMSRNVKKLS